MKKIFILAILALCAFTAEAQIQIDTQKSKHEIVCRARGGTVWISFYQKGDYQIYSLVLPSSNRFDDPFSICLGEDVDEALTTLNSFYPLFDIEPNEALSIKDVKGVEMNITMMKVFGAQTLYFQRDRWAGNVYLSKSELTKLIERFSAKYSK